MQMNRQVLPTLPPVWLTLGLLGVSIRIWLWWFSIGSNDAVLWNGHGMHVATAGLAQTYRNFRIFNHPPLMGLYAAQAWRWTAGGALAFARLIKLPGLIGEAIIMVVLWRSAGPRACVVYACLPAAILVSGYHGNTDCLCAALVLVAALAFDREHYFLSGLLWSAALNVKVIPLVLLPLVFLGVPNRRALLRLSAGFALGLVPFVPLALTTGSSMYRNMIAYNSNPDNWGITALLNRGLGKPSLEPIFGPLREWWLATGRYAILLSITAVALLSRFHRRMPMVEQTALGVALFLIFAPGFGVQYVIYAAPLLCLVDLTEGVWWGWTSGIFIGAVYFLFVSSWAPLQSDFHRRFPFPANAIGMLSWMVLIHFVWYHLSAGSAAWWGKRFRLPTLWASGPAGESSPTPLPYTVRGFTVGSCGASGLLIHEQRRATPERETGSPYPEGDPALPGGS